MKDDFVNVRLSKREIELLVVGLNCLDSELEFGDRERIEEEYEGIDSEEVYKLSEYLNKKL